MAKILDKQPIIKLTAEERLLEKANRVFDNLEEISMVMEAREIASVVEITPLDRHNKPVATIIFVFEKEIVKKVLDAVSKIEKEYQEKP